MTTPHKHAVYDSTLKVIDGDDFRLDAMAREDKTEIVCFGDSITQGTDERGNWPDELQENLDEWQKGKFEVINKGISGDTTARAFDRFENDVIANLPCLLLIEFGINDSNYRNWAKVQRVGLEEFEKNLLEFYRVCIAHRGRCVFIVNHTIAQPEIKSNGKLHTDNLKPYNSAIRRIANQTKSPLIDLPEMMQAQNIDLDEFLCEDKGHLSKTGTAIYAEMVFERLKLYGEASIL